MNFKSWPPALRRGVLKKALLISKPKVFKTYIFCISKVDYKKPKTSSITQSKIHIGMRYKGSAAAETMMIKAASLFGQ